PAAWPPTGPVLSRLLWSLLLSAAVHFLRRAFAVRKTASGGHRWGRRLAEASRKDCETGSSALAAGEDNSPRRQRLLPGQLDDLVRAARCRLPLRIGEKPAINANSRRGTARRQTRARSYGRAGTRLQ